MNSPPVAATPVTLAVTRARTTTAPPAANSYRPAAANCSDS
ncbi:hypothetical protein [Streptomyces sp. NPDC058297]